jgi:poly-beta-1,6-N-acetyl-D-glucosamine N-deacetylase
MHYTRFLVRVFLPLLLLFQAGQIHATDTFDAICYHGVRNIRQGDMSPDQFALDTQHLLTQFEWLYENEFHPISMDDLFAAQKGEKPLPEKAVLLSFDDGYLSFYTTIYPLLRLYNYPAIFALVGSWLEVQDNTQVQYGDEKLLRSNFLTWPQIQEMQDSGLIEFASHSYDLHKGIIGNPQQNAQPAATTRKYNDATHQYETDKKYLDRIRKDLAKNSTLIEEKTGRRPRIMVWPYGAFNKETQEIATNLGMETNLLLEDENQNLTTNLQIINRKLIEANPDLSDFAYMLNRVPGPAPERMIHVDLDYVYDENPEQQERNLDMLLDRVKKFTISTVYLQAFADPDGDGNVDALYFPNRHLPMRADLFNRVAWQLRTRAGVRVYAWMPVLAFDLGRETFNQLGVKEYRDGKIRNTNASYRRLSPFNNNARKIIHDIYADLGRYSQFYGILFHDDAYLTDFEDFSEDARQFYKEQGIKATLEDLTTDQDLVQRLAEIKTDYLINFTTELTDTVRRYHPDIKTARNMYARPVLDPISEQWFAQNLEKFVAHYDTTAIMAMPYMEQADNPEKWLARLLDTVKKRIPPFNPANPDMPNISKVLFELQAKDWETERPIQDTILAGQIRYLLQHGINKIGYYPDNFHKNQPNLETIRTIFSLQTFPYRRK